MSPHERPLLQKTYPNHDVIMVSVDFGKKTEKSAVRSSRLAVMKITKHGYRISLCKASTFSIVLDLYEPWAKGYQCMGRQARGLQSARAYAKCAGPRKMRGPTQNVRAQAKCAGPHKASGLRYAGGGRQVRGHARNAWAAVQLRGPNWVRGPQLRGEVSRPHCPRTSPALAIQCPRNATAVPLAWAAMSRNRPAR